MNTADHDDSTILGGAIHAGEKLHRIVNGDTPLGGPDGWLIQLCEQHAINHQAYCRDNSDLEPEDDPSWLTYISTSNAIDAARPQTLAGVVAKARCALIEAKQPSGRYGWDGSTGGRWAGDLMGDLIRLARAGEGVAFQNMPDAKSANGAIDAKTRPSQPVTAVNALDEAVSAIESGWELLISLSLSPDPIPGHALRPIVDFLGRTCADARRGLEAVEDGV